MPFGHAHLRFGSMIKDTEGKRANNYIEHCGWKRFRNTRLKKQLH